ncbi:hypothetical protein Q674_03195 [Acinetobacter sp. COS3]|uniref:PilX N-terminal domain-containing pilus assembly protein n=1 Tax=Acinetobacter sp. COS3 TaxID=1397525 RepID=UPI0003B8F056|nr:PilX N-terminal domain-containing pilus assembly protein [Acinetobacter sp. COS3]ERQ00135.1 hypothetical protein Q674_03195 [Acinetobacter sp. COS3]
MKRTQRGATLIVVLILLLIMTVVGTLAIRGSLTTLNIATNSQAQQLMLQNSDSAIFHSEDPNRIIWNTSLSGLFGWINLDVNKGKELVFCYRGTEASFFDSSKASAIQWVSGNAPDNTEKGLDGFCQLDDTENFFTSARKAVMTQVMVKTDISADTLAGIENPFEHMQKGTDVDKAKVMQSSKIIVMTTSIVPAMSSASDADINACFKTHMNIVVIPNGVTPDTGKDKSVAQCLQTLGVPVTTQVTEYTLIQPPVRTT